MGWECGGPFVVEVFESVREVFGSGREEEGCGWEDEGGLLLWEEGGREGARRIRPPGCSWSPLSTMEWNISSDMLKE